MKTRVAVTMLGVILAIITSDFWLPLAAKYALDSAWPLGGKISRFSAVLLIHLAHLL